MIGQDIFQDGFPQFALSRFLFLLLATAVSLLFGCTAPTPEDVAAQPVATIPSTAVIPTTQPTITPPTVAAPSPTPLPTTAATATSAPTATPLPTATATTAPPIIPGPPELLPTPQGVYSWTLRVPILMYHYLSEPPADADIYRVDLSVSPDNFYQQMAYLSENGYTPIDLYDLSLAIVNKIDLPEKPVVLTFDDGYLDNYENAFPILQEFGFTATFFVITDYVDQQLPGYATWPMLREMAAAGMRIESHSKNHPDLNGQDRDFQIWQLVGSQETLAAHLGYTPRFFCYPSGRYDATTISILQEAGYWGAVTTQGGSWHGHEDRYEWRRLRMRYDTSLNEFIDLVDPGNTRGGIAQ